MPNTTTPNPTTPNPTTPNPTTNPVGQMSSLLNMSAANWPNRGRTVSLDFDNSDFFYFQNYEFGQYETGSSTSPSPKKQLINGRPTNVVYGPSENDFYTVNNILHTNIECSASDISFIDSPLCDPASPDFVKLWANPSNKTSIVQKCYRSQTCANSLLSQSLSSMTASKGGQEKRKQDLEDIYFYDCMNVFNMCIAILYFIYIIFTKLALPSPSSTASSVASSVPSSAASLAAMNLLPTPGKGK